jgi:RecA/RadA recombinase
MKLKALSDSIREISHKPHKKAQDENFNFVASTGSTLLDLAISGKRRRGGGIPGGILVELFGPSSVGKSSLLASIMGNIQRGLGGDIYFADPEHRLDKEYAEIFGLLLSEKFKDCYSRPKTVKTLMDLIMDWCKDEHPEKVLNGFGADSLAALCSDMELDDEDKMGMKRAKDFSEGLRKICSIISAQNKLVVFTNQVRQNVTKVGWGNKEKTTGGEALPFYASLRMRIGPDAQPKIRKELTFHSNKVSKVIGIRSSVYIAKSSVDESYREATLSFMNGYGLDDIRENLIYLKTMNHFDGYPIGGKRIKSLDEAIKIVEEDNLMGAVKEEVIDLWEEIDSKFRIERKPKVF